MKQETPIKYDKLEGGKLVPHTASKQELKDMVTAATSHNSPNRWAYARATLGIYCDKRNSKKAERWINE